MTIGEMKRELLGLYGKGPNSWTVKVNKMSESQITAIYLSMKKRGKFDKKEKSFKIIGGKN